MARPKPNTTGTISFPAPTGGLNLTTPITATPSSDLIKAFNVTASEYGLRVRCGYEIYGTAPFADRYEFSDLAGTVIFKPVTSSTSHTLMAAYKDGATAGIGRPGEAFDIEFPGVAGNATIGMFINFTNLSGIWTIYCDEQYGLYISPPSGSDTAYDWFQVEVKATWDAWVGSTGYGLGDRVQNGGVDYICTKAGTSDTSGGPTGFARTIVDGTAEWDWTPGIAGANPLYFAYVVAWKNRLWFVSRNTLSAWYLPLNSIIGTVTEFKFGAQFKTGGTLASLHNWTRDGGAGIDDGLVALSSEGDVVVYEGVDPDITGGFALRGAWQIGTVPAGRRFATDWGGDLYIMSLSGILPLSALLSGLSPSEAATSLSWRITNYFQAYGSQLLWRSPGWAVHHNPIDATLVFTVVNAIGDVSLPTIIAMSTVNRSWSFYRGLPVSSGATVYPVTGELFFTADIEGNDRFSICSTSDYYIDGYDALAATATGTAIDASFVTAAISDGKNKLPKLIRVNFLERQAAATGYGVFSTMAAQMQLGGATSEATAPDEPDSASQSLPSAIYLNPKTLVFGAYGMDRIMAVAVRFKTRTRTIITTIDVTADSGGVL